MNLYPTNVSAIHIELTDKCQASCPMCARNYMGGAERPFVGKHEILLDDFKKWFNPDFLSRIKNFYACGNYGDPIIAKDCLEIFDWVKTHTTDARLSIHTNGSARTPGWWRDLAKIINGTSDVTFGIDGYKDSHALYRRGTSWDKIIENATEFISAGGNAKIDTLVFKHNEHEIEQFREEMLALGFSQVNIKYTGRFYNMDKFPVYDANGNYEYDLLPSSVNPTQHINIDQISKNIDLWRDTVAASEIEPKCIKKQEIYVDSRGTVYPCCWIGSDMIEEHIEAKIQLHTLRNKFVDNSVANFKSFNQLNLKNIDINTILSNSDIWNFLDTTKPWTCVKNCTK